MVSTLQKNNKQKKQKRQLSQLDETLNDFVNGNSVNVNCSESENLEQKAMVSQMVLRELAIVCVKIRS